MPIYTIKLKYVGDQEWTVYSGLTGAKAHHILDTISLDGLFALDIDEED